MDINTSQPLKLLTRGNKKKITTLFQKVNVENEFN